MPQLSLNDPFNPKKCHNHTLLSDNLAMVVKGLLVHNIFTYKFICYSTFFHTNLFAIQHSYIQIYLLFSILTNLLAIQHSYKQINLLFSILTYKIICYSTFLFTILFAIQHLYLQIYLLFNILTYKFICFLTFLFYKFICYPTFLHRNWLCEAV